jgi:hypothetical protein
MTVHDVIQDFRANPGQLLRQWNWKSAAFSSTFRAAIFFGANLTAGWRAATAAMMTEFVYRAVTAGFYGATTQAFRRAEPVWAAGLVVMILLPVASHSVELTVHLLRGTPRILTSLIASVAFTAISTLFNLYAMRRGVLVVGSGSSSVGADMRRLPSLIAGFTAAGPRALLRFAQGFSQRFPARLEGPE